MKKMSVKFRKITAIFTSVMITCSAVQICAAGADATPVREKSAAEAKNGSGDNRGFTVNDEDSAREVFSDLTRDTDSPERAFFREYPVEKNDAFEYYKKKYGDRFFSVLSQLAQSSISRRQQDKDSDRLSKVVDAVAADAGESAGAISWKVSGTTLTVSGSGAIADYYAPYFFEDREKAPWMSYNDTVTKIVIESGITKLGNHAFHNFKKVTDIVIPSTVTQIGSYTFEDCDSLTTVTLPGSLTEIDAFAFCYCDSLKRIVLPEGLKRLGESAFESCESLNYAYMGKELQVVGGNPFAGCKALTEFNLSSSNPYLYISNYTLFDKSGALLAYPPGRSSISSYSVPSGTKTIGKCAFSNATFINSVTIPDSVVKIEDRAFYFADLSSITLGNGLEDLGDYVFFVNSLSSVTLPSSLTRIGEEAFSCSEYLKTINIPKNVKSIGRAAFNSCHSMKTITADSGNLYYKTIDGVLYSKDGTLLHTYPSGKTTSSFSIPSTVVTIGDYAVQFNNYLSEVTIPNSVRSILWYNFSDCTKIETIVVPDSVTLIDVSCFSNMDSLTRITFGTGVTHLHDEYIGIYSCVLWGSYNCDHVYFRGDLPTDYQVMLYRDEDQHDVTVHYPKDNPTWKNGSIKLGYSYLKLKSWDGINYDKTPLTDDSVKLGTTTYTYDGTAKKPSVTVTANSKKLVEGKEFSVSYSSNTNAGTGKVTVTGIGNYKGTVTKSFTIHKAKQNLSVRLSETSVRVGKFTNLYVSGRGSISYKLSNSSVVTLYGTGVIWGEKTGKTDITVTASGDDNYSSASSTVTLNVTGICNPLSVKNLSYNFSNSPSSFNYSSNFKIPYERYLMFYTATQAQAEYNSTGTWGGSCSGFVSSSLLFNSPYVPSLKITDFRSSASYLSDLRVSDYSSKMGKTLQAFMESMQVCGLYGEAGTAYCGSKNNFKDLVDEVKRSQNGGLPVYIAVWQGSSSGHALAGYKYVNYSSKEDRIYLYDCNYPKTERYLTLYKSGSNYTGFYYDGGSHKYSSHLYYVPAYKFEDIWKYRKTKDNSSAVGASADGDDFVEMPAEVDEVTMYINSDNFAVYDASAKKVAEMKNGELDSSDSGVYDILKPDTETTCHELRLPTSEYTVKSFDDSYKNQFELTAVNANQSVSVNTESDTVRFLVDDSQNANLVNVSGDSGEKYEITFNGDNIYTVDNEKVLYSGKSKGGSLTVGTIDGEYINKEYTQSGIREDDIAINLPNSNYANMDISNYSVKLSQSSFRFTGNPIEPEFTIVDHNGVTLSPNEDYKVVYVQNTGAGTAHAEIYGINDFFGCLTFDFTISAVSISNCSASLEYNECEYTGNEFEPGVTLMLSGVALEQDKHFKVSYSNNIQTGTANVLITGMNGVTGSRTLNFTIKEASHIPEDDPALFEYIVQENGTLEITKYLGDSTEISIPKMIDGKTVTSIGSSLFYKNSNVDKSEITKVHLPDTINYISSYAFCNCENLTSVNLPDDIVGVGAYAFYGCKKLNVFPLPQSLKKIFKCAFAYCLRAEEKVEIPDGVTSVGEHAFYDTLYRYGVTVPKSVETIDAYAFGYFHMDDQTYYYKSFPVYGYKGTAAEQFANDYKLTFVPLDDEKRVLCGDVNNDGSVNGADAGLLSRYVSGWKGYEDKIQNKDAADLNRDGTVNGADAGLLSRYASGWNGYDKYIIYTIIK